MMSANKPNEREKTMIEIIDALIRKCEREADYWRNMRVELTDPAFQTERPREYAPAPKPADIGDPTAKGTADLVTPKQLGMIRALAREAGVDAELECGFVMKCGTQDLSKRAASSFIDHLKEAGQQKAGVA